MEMLRAIAIGLPLTVLVTILALMIGTVVALPIVAGLRSKNRILWLMSRALVDLLRGVPPVVWLFILYYGVSIGAIRLTALQAGVLGLGVVAAAYLAEIFRGAISSIPKGAVGGQLRAGLPPGHGLEPNHRSANGTGRRPGLHDVCHRAAQGFLHRLLHRCGRDRFHVQPIRPAVRRRHHGVLCGCGRLHTIERSAGTALEAP